MPSQSSSTSLHSSVAPGTTAQGLRELLGEQHPALLRVPVAFAVNQDYARAETVLSDGDEVAFIPPISGGSGERDLFRFDLGHDALDARALEQGAELRRRVEEALAREAR